jgi:hypothetical protein
VDGTTSCSQDIDFVCMMAGLSLDMLLSVHQTQPRDELRRNILEFTDVALGLCQADGMSDSITSMRSITSSQYKQKLKRLINYILHKIALHLLQSSLHHSNTE